VKRISFLNEVIMGHEDVVRILIVEDLPTDAELAEREARRALPESQFMRVETREGFLSALKSFSPDLILSDYKLPHFDGMSALRLALERVPETPFIIVTGSMNEETAVTCMKAGAWDYVIKEHVKRLGPAVLGALEQKRLRRERKQVEEALANEAIRRRILIEQSKDGIVILQQDGSVYEANRRFAEMLGCSPDEVLKLHVWDWEFLFPKERVLEMLRSVDEMGNSFETQHRRKDGTTYHVEISSNGALFAGQKLVFCVCRDITERKQAEEKHERMLAAIEQTGDVVLITDVEGTIQYVNPAFETSTGYTREEALLQNLRILKSGEQDAVFYRALWETVANGGTWKGRIVNRRKDGTGYTEAATISPVRDRKGRIVNYVAVKRDITEQLRLAEQFQQAQKMESVGRLAGGVAHDYNNMLSVILGYTELALRKMEPGSPFRGDLEEVRKAALRSADITRQLLAFARKQTIAPEVLDLNGTVEGMLKMLRRLIGEDIDLAWMPGANVWRVRMDPSQVDQILANLCVNARDAIADVGKITIGTGSITFDEADCVGHPGLVPGEYALLAVSDDGCGMERETLDKIFEPFFTTKGVGEGTGLGLATVYGIVKQNNGFINVYSEPGNGTTFRVYLPRFADQTVETKKETLAEMPQGRGETVLLVEDDPSVLGLTENLLGGLGYVVLTAGRPGEAIKLAKQHSGEIHLLMTDVVMPEMNGQELAERLRTTRRSMKCLFMSGYTANVIVHRGVLNEGVKFIQKPFPLRKLADKVRGALDEA
jgi:two-component system, cell cycle sensor histidine kinase and response regulator CckA